MLESEQTSILSFNGDLKVAFTHDSGEDLFMQNLQEEKIIEVCI